MPGNNPYTLVFGKEPKELINRVIPEDEVIQEFLAEEPSQQIYMVTGVRGVGKTVFMTNIANRIRKEPDWIVVELNPELDMLTGLASKLSSNNVLARLFRDASINLSFFGFGLEVKNTAPISDIETALSRMLESIKKSGKRVLITIDEASNTRGMRAFASAFQIFLRQDLPVYLLMTGLYENIYELQNEKNLTFLYRAPKIELRALNLGAIAHNYKTNFNLSDDAAAEMARITKGYSFAFQLLGYLTWKQGGDYSSVIPAYRQYLEEYVYEKLWSSLSNNDRKIAYGIAASKDGKIAEVREILGIDTNSFNPYRKRLIKKGIISGDIHGYVEFVLPFFKEFVLDAYV
jgi:hypothetical protein